MNGLLIILSANYLIYDPNLIGLKLMDLNKSGGAVPIRPLNLRSPNTNGPIDLV